MTLIQVSRGRIQSIALGLLFSLPLAVSAQTSETPPLDSISFQLLTREMPADLKERYREAIAQDPALRKAVFGRSPTAGLDSVGAVGASTDLNGDGVTDVSDVQLAINQARGLSVCATGDVNKDGACNVADIQMIVVKALGR